MIFNIIDVHARRHRYGYCFFMKNSKTNLTGNLNLSIGYLIDNNVIGQVQVNLCEKLFFLQNMERTCCVQNCS